MKCAVLGKRNRVGSRSARAARPGVGDGRQHTSRYRVTRPEVPLAGGNAGRRRGLSRADPKCFTGYRMSVLPKEKPGSKPGMTSGTCSGSVGDVEGKLETNTRRDQQASSPHSCSKSRVAEIVLQLGGSPIAASCAAIFLKNHTARPCLRGSGAWLAGLSAGCTSSSANGSICPSHASSQSLCDESKSSSAFPHATPCLGQAPWELRFAVHVSLPSPSGTQNTARIGPSNLAGGSLLSEF